MGVCEVEQWKRGKSPLFFLTVLLKAFWTENRQYGDTIAVVYWSQSLVPPSQWHHACHEKWQVFWTIIYNSHSFYCLGCFHGRSLFRSGNAANHAAMRSKGKFVAQNIHRKPITEWLLYWCCAHSLLPLHWGVITVTITCKTLCFNCKWSSLDNLATTSQTALIFLASPHFLSDMTLALPYFRFIPAGTSLPFHQRCCWPVTWSFRFYSRSWEITHLLSFQLLLLFRGMARMLMRWHAKNTFLHAELIAQKQLLMCFHVSVDAAAELPEVRCSQKKKNVYCEHNTVT